MIALLLTGGECVLPSDLQCIVEEDNAAFMEEIAEYDAKKEREKQVSWWYMYYSNGRCVFHVTQLYVGIMVYILVY